MRATSNNLYIFSNIELSVEPIGKGKRRIIGQTVRYLKKYTDYSMLLSQLDIFGQFGFKIRADAGIESDYGAVIWVTLNDDGLTVAWFYSAQTKTLEANNDPMGRELVIAFGTLGSAGEIDNSVMEIVSLNHLEDDKIAFIIAAKLKKDDTSIYRLLNNPEQFLSAMAVIDERRGHVNTRFHVYAFSHENVADWSK